MNLIQIWLKVAFLAAMTTLASFASAQTEPQLQPLDEDLPPTVTIKKPSEARENKIEERRDRGTVKEIKVQSGASTYYLKPSGDGQRLSSAQWKIKEFGVSDKKKPDESPESAPPPDKQLPK